MARDEWEAERVYVWYSQSCGWVALRVLGYIGRSRIRQRQVLSVRFLASTTPPHLQRSRRRFHYGGTEGAGEVRFTMWPFVASFVVGVGVGAAVYRFATKHLR